MKTRKKLETAKETGGVKHGFPHESQLMHYKGHQSSYALDLGASDPCLQYL